MTARKYNQNCSTHTYTREPDTYQHKTQPNTRQPKQRKTPHLETDIYRKPTTTDTTINFLSNHPIEHKTDAFRYHIIRMHSPPLTTTRKQKEWEIIQQIAKNKNFPQHLLHRINLQTKHKNTH
jgi:hypothetical protein